MKLNLFVLFSMLFLGHTAGKAQATAHEIKANHPDIRYVGRTLVQADGSVSFDWTGTYLETQFKGSSVSIQLSESGTSYYNVFVDNQLHRVVKACGQDTLINFVSGVNRQWHHLRIQKRTEGEYGRTTLHLFKLASSGRLQKAPQTRNRHIEFIGNSLTCGYGVDGKHRDDPFKLETENCDHSYANIIARYFDADCTLLAHSGRGVVRNYGDSVRVSAISMKDKMLQTFDEDTKYKWDFQSYKADLVVINLGTNDFCLEPHPYKSEFVQAYVQMLQNIRKAYGDIPILCIYCCTIPVPVYHFYEEAVAQMNDKNIHLLPFQKELLDDNTDLGAVWHPNYNGQRKMALAMIPYISTITGWELASKMIE